ncbi:MAG: hypothetical protein AcusKO_46140 [Acuticoccus sp.]
MAGDQPDCEAVLLGTPRFIRGGRSVLFPTRKSFALCVYLTAQPGVSVDRARLCGLLWGDFDSEAARVSLRKALSLIHTNEDTASFIERARATVRSAIDPARTDLAIFIDLISRGTEACYRDALKMWRGEPLAGAEIGEGDYDDWVREFRTTTVAQVLRHLNAQISEMEARTDSPSQLMALCELIVHIDPSEVTASERLMRHHARGGDPAAAMRRLRLLRNALDALDIALPSHLIAFEKSLRSASLGEPSEDGAIAPFQGVPTVMLQKPFGMPQTPDLFAYVHSEVMCQLTRFRSLRSFERLPEDKASDPAAARAVSAVALNSGLEHDYRLLLWNEPNAQALYLRCINARRQQTVSCVRLGYDQLTERGRADLMIANAVNAVERDILNEDAPHPNSPFAKWLAAYKEMQKFTERSDELAYEILQELLDDPRASRLSLVHSSIAAIFLKRRMYSPSERREGDEEDAWKRVQTALNIDDQEPFNHVMAGWMSIQGRDYERAMASFEVALSLNPFSSRTLISAAEAFAFCGDIAAAKRLAERAMALSGHMVPAYFHSYLATIAYLDGDLEECTRRLHRAPQNGQTLLLAIAAHQERNELAAAAGARSRFEEQLQRADTIEQETLKNWMVAANMTRDSQTRRRMFGALERAGLSVALGHAH